MEVENIFFLRFLVINAENAAHKSEKFSAMATRTRHEYLKDLATNYVTNTTLETGAKGKGKLLNVLTIHVVIMILAMLTQVWVQSTHVKHCLSSGILRSTKKKEKVRPQICPEKVSRGALVWNVQVMWPTFKGALSWRFCGILAKLLKYLTKNLFSNIKLL